MSTPFCSKRGLKSSSDSTVEAIVTRLDSNLWNFSVPRRTANWDFAASSFSQSCEPWKTAGPPETGSFELSRWSAKSSRESEAEFRPRLRRQGRQH